MRTPINWTTATGKRPTHATPSSEGSGEAASSQPSAGRGRLYRYHRVTGAKLPSDVPEDAPTFIAAWTAEEAKAGEPKRPRGTPGTISAAIEALIASEKWRSLSESYRGLIRRELDEIREAYGDAPFGRLEAKHINADIGKHPAIRGRKRRKAWRLLCTWSIAAGLIQTDPSAATATPPSPKTEGHRPWTYDEVEKVRDRWSIEHPRRLAFELVYWTGAGRADVVRMNRGMISAQGTLDYARQKTGAGGCVPWSCALPPFADRETHAHLMACLEAQRPDFMLIETRTGKPRSAKAFGQWLAETARLAGVAEGRTAHGLRKLRAMDLAERGVSPLGLMSWCAWLSLTEAQHYIESANRRRSIMGTEHDRNPAKSSGKIAKFR